MSWDRCRSTNEPFMFATASSFILLATLLASQAAADGFGLLVQIRAAVLADFIAELPIGRQALVSSGWLLPLPGFAALPFLPFLPVAGYGYACLYGTALVVALNTLPLAGLLRRLRLPVWGTLPAALLLQAAGAEWLGASGAGDWLACLALLSTALFLEGETALPSRALAGVFYGLALLTHPVGIAVAALRLLVMAVRRWTVARGHAEQQAVDFTRLVSIAYCAAILLFLNWMIMRDPLFPAQHFRWSRPTATVAQALEALEQELAGPLASFLPVASGHWSYLAQPLLKRRQGRGFIDFHPDKLHAGETRSPLLILPQPGNPLDALADIDRVPGAVLLSQTPQWRFYLVPRGRP
jgi:hypothetical protein